MGDEYKIRVEHLTKIFGRNHEEALRLLQAGETKEDILEKTRATVGVYDASFEVKAGEVFVVMGLSGSGKSTLIRCLNRLYEPTSGKILVDEEDVTAADARKLREIRRTKFGMVFQRFALLPNRDVVGNVEYGLEVQGAAEEERREKALEMLDLVGLKGWADSKPSELSGGMQQRVGLARALAVDPDILLMDEAFSALDPLIRREMQDELISLQSRVNKTIVFITHDLDEALKLGDRIAVMRDGRIVQVGTPEQIVQSPATDYVAAFTESVDRTQFLTAGSIMQPALTVISPKEGPSSALRKMRQWGISSVFVMDRAGTLRGIATADAVAQAFKQKEENLLGVMEKDVHQVDVDTPLQDVVDMGATATGPIAVVDEVDGERRLKGVIVRGVILATLAQLGRNGNGNGDSDDRKPGNGSGDYKRGLMGPTDDNDSRPPKINSETGGDPKQTQVSDPDSSELKPLEPVNE